MSEDSSEDNIEISGSSYARLFNNGTNIQLSNDIGKLFTTFHSKSIKQGNNLEEFINEFMEACSGDDSEMTAYCNCMLTQLMLNYTVEDMEVLTEEDMIKMDGFEDCVGLLY